MDLHAYRQLPIPEWLELSCPRCDYSLRGLPEHRCPECGLRFDIDDLVTSTTPLRPPEITPATRPVPDLGIDCGRCEQPLHGIDGNTCPVCGEPFDLADSIPPRLWADVSRGLDALQCELTFHRLRDAGIPCLYRRPNTALDTALGAATSSFRTAALQVRRDYYLDALQALTTFGRPGESPWTCPTCREEVPGNFDVCWNCQSARDENAT